MTRVDCPVFSCGWYYVVENDDRKLEVAEAKRQERAHWLEYHEYTPVDRLEDKGGR